MVQVVRLGRKRKSGRRKPSGDLAASRVDTREQVMNQPHRIALENKLDQRAESELGNLNIHGFISDEQYEAGRRWAAIVGRYRAVIEAPKASASTCGVMASSGLTTAMGEFITDKECLRRRERYNRAWEAVDGSGRRCALTVARTAIYGERCPPGNLGYLKIGLSALAHHFGLTNPRKSDGGGKRIVEVYARG